VIYMGMTRLHDITAALIHGGRSPATPAAVISQGTTGDQRHVITTLGTLAEAVQQAAIPTPALAIVGEVVTVREEFTTLATAALPTGVLG
jgi:siroheme synthase